ncbi:hypothetical protein [Myxosarcina sp. GI1]|uniref:hypothetical protein n=1 Tax=Myxosarcina sp. GI1 TaxID=1541065 RepID=UPI000567286D|nr:hypothetical protein [Myxosarcina sp. GI1]
MEFSREFKEHFKKDLEMAKQLEMLGYTGFVRDFCITAIEGYKEGQREQTADRASYEKVKAWLQDNPAETQIGEVKRLYLNPGEKVFMTKDDKTGHYEIKYEYRLPGIDFWFTHRVLTHTANLKKAKKIKRQMVNAERGMELRMVGEQPRICQLLIIWEPA